MGRGVLVSVFLLFLLPWASFAEGTKQIAPFAVAEGKLCIDKSRNDFAFFNAPPEFMLNIYIASLTEKICFGLGQVHALDSIHVQYQLRDPAGKIVIGPDLVPKSGKGFISSYRQDTIGPFAADSGYDPIEHTPLLTGNYSLEFYYPPDQNPMYTYMSYTRFEFFDITVLNAAGKPLPGRVWSKAWQFNCGPVEPPETTSRFYGTMYILSDDSIVTSINCNGFIGGTFSISSNQTGCSTTGNIAVDRQSRTGFHTYPQFKVFLTDPDSTIFPTGKAQPAIILPVTIANDCATGSVDFGVKVSQDGFIEVLIEIDTMPGATPPMPVKLTANVFAHPGGNGFNIIRWNGKDGFGIPQANGTTGNATLRFIHGITHLPIYDIEYNDHGYIVEVVRPPGPKPAIYWDDTLLPYGDSNLTGCMDAVGCHLWENARGDTNTINSWWYVASLTAPKVSFRLKRKPGIPAGINGDPTFCEGGITRQYTIRREASSTSYNWSYSGTGATIIANDTIATVVYSDSTTSGILSVSGYNQDCGSGEASTLQITFFPPPQVNLAVFDSICHNELALRLTGGTPSGGEYYVDGSHETGFDPAAAGPGIHLVTYLYTDSHGCKNSDSSLVFVKSGRECEIVIRVPNAFSPNGDGLNDHFQPYTENVRNFTMNIYNRSGQLVFTSGNPTAGWDGTYQGSPCPVENYVYLIVYESSHAPPKNSTLTGNVVLVR
jgi:gliding motility-associated-like protein